MEKPDFSTYTTLDFVSWHQNAALELSPKFQRRSVWNRSAKSYLIDSLLIGIPIPPIFIRMSQNSSRTKVVREIIDGQQRLRALLEFVNDEYSLSKGVNKKYAGKTFSDLTLAEQDAINSFRFMCEVYSSISDADVLEIFARVNTYSIPLNGQELRNGRFFGLFKQSCFSLAREHLEFWRANRVYGEVGIARMLEVELTSELVVASLSGQQDKKNSLDKFYGEFDESFPAQAKIENRFRKTIDSINEACGSLLSESEFRRPPLFYTLFCVVYHRLFGLPKAPIATPASGRLTQAESKSLKNAIDDLTDVLERSKDAGGIAAKDANFVAACTRQTDNIKPRDVRFTHLYKLAF